jgi:hypothetical protein
VAAREVCDRNTVGVIPSAHPQRRGKYVTETIWRVSPSSGVIFSVS